LFFVVGVLRKGLSPIWNYLERTPSQCSKCLACPSFLKGWYPNHAEKHLRAKHPEIFEAYRKEKKQWTQFKLKSHDTWLGNLFNNLSSSN